MAAKASDVFTIITDDAGREQLGWVRREKLEQAEAEVARLRRELDALTHPHRGPSERNR